MLYNDQRAPPHTHTLLRNLLPWPTAGLPYQQFINTQTFVVIEQSFKAYQSFLGSPGKYQVPPWLLLFIRACSLHE